MKRSGMGKWTKDFNGTPQFSRWLTNEDLVRFIEEMEQLHLVDADTISGDDPHTKKSLQKYLGSLGPYYE